MSKRKSFLGQGFNFPFKVDRNGNIAMSAHEKSVEQAIEIIIGTAPGERQMRPDFGCKIHDLVFAPANLNTCALASSYVREALTMNEHRIQDLEVDCKLDPNSPNKLQLQISYVVAASNNYFNRVYPFYLRREEDL
ncbi:MAG: baseplate protein [Myxococcales bacterium]|nr:baseplate protein [Myxococcales bacterium]